jgi:SAM-dependent methyltransferase
LGARRQTGVGSEVKAHVGCGSVYLSGYLNIDLPMSNVFTSWERPDLVDKWATTEGHYYARHEEKNADTTRGGPIEQQTVCDAYGSFSFLPVRSGIADEILSRQVFEHLPQSDAVEAFRECARVLKYGGILRIDVPDPDETLRKYHETGDEFYLRHLFGPRRDQYGGHTMYNRKMLITIAEESGLFRYLSEEENCHFYPAFTLRFERC